MAEATLLISSKNYSSWSLRGYLLVRLSGLPFREIVANPDDPNVRAELLLRSSSIRVPSLIHDGATVWDTLAIAEYLNEIRPEAGMLPTERKARAHCRSVSAEMHSGFSAMRSSLPMNLRGHSSNHTIWSSAQADIDNIIAIWTDCFTRYDGPWLFGASPTIADAFYAPVVTRFLTYDVKLDARCRAFCAHIMAWKDMQEWVAAARVEPEQIDELEVDMDF
jgi:glutathione S-transferase